MSFCRPSARTRPRPTAPNPPLPPPAPESFVIEQHLVKPPRCAPNTGQLYLPVEPLITLPSHRIFTHHEPPSHPMRTNPSALQAPIVAGYSPPASPDYDLQIDTDPDILLTDGLHVSQDPLATASRNSRKKMKQWQRWSSEVIPSLIQPYLKYRRLSNGSRNEVIREPPLCENGCPRCQLKVVRVTFNGLEAVELTICMCTPAALQLL
ncbi:hypothetical protein HYDPIDRAFT_31679 [Hydnomerulius pinastri MD-312]|uniref:Uncharacterized protein n=1 Tax=Hydnomerulius pinastri MD-312 TaxID=994086 RepID=A0A0C9V6G2_9AGAM|nr:hypothetical protein HYDPIDRAFT_31679 [Hydnomerulius pinastri MD-312]